MANISVNLETLQSGQIRVTGRIEGRTIEYRDGLPGEAKDICNTILERVAFAHQLPGGGYDLTHIRLNNAAAQALSFPVEAA